MGQPRAGRQLHPESSPLGDVRQARVAAATGMLDCGEDWDVVGIVDYRRGCCQVYVCHAACRVGTRCLECLRCCSKCW